MEHQVHSHGYDSAMRARISIPENLKRLAQAALRHVPNSQQLIDKAFSQSLIPKQLNPQPQPDLVFHSGFNDV